MRILLLSSSYPPITGGLQTVAHNLAVGFVHQDHPTEVVTQLYPRSLPANETLDGIPVSRWMFINPQQDYLIRLRFDLYLAGMYYSRSTQHKLDAMIDNFQPDVINLHFPDHQIPYVLASKRKKNIPLVVSLHGDEILRWFRKSLTKNTSKIHKDQLHQVLQRADQVTACSQYLLDKACLLEPGIAEKSQVIGNGIDLRRFEDKKAFKHPRPYLFSFGRLTYAKGFDLLIEAFSHLHQDFPGFDLVIAGDGEERAALEALVGKYSLQDQVTFFGTASPVEVVQLLNGCQLVVIPSRREPFGITALEALASGKPLVATRVGGIPEFIPPRGNCLVEPDPDDLQRGISKLINSPPSPQTSQDNRSRSSQFTWESVTANYLQVFFKAVSLC